MSKRPPDFEAPEPEDDLDLGEPVTDKLNVLLEELSDEWDEGGKEVDISEPVTDKLSVLLDHLPEDWDSEHASAEEADDFADQVTDKLSTLLSEMPGDGLLDRAGRSAELRRLTSGAAKWSPRGMAIGLAELVKALFRSPRDR